MEVYEIQENDTGEKVATEITRMFNEVKNELSGSVYESDATEGQREIDTGFLITNRTLVVVNKQVLDSQDYSFSSTKVTLFYNLYEGDRILIKK